jgi:hypothetical protein
MLRGWLSGSWVPIEPNNMEKLNDCGALVHHHTYYEQNFKNARRNQTWHAFYIPISQASRYSVRVWDLKSGRPNYLQISTWRVSPTVPLKYCFHVPSAQHLRIWIRLRPYVLYPGHHNRDHQVAVEYLHFIFIHCGKMTIIRGVSDNINFAYIYRTVKSIRVDNGIITDLHFTG